jgi:hypothetical protein
MVGPQLGWESYDEQSFPDPQSASEVHDAATQYPTGSRHTQICPALQSLSATQPVTHWHEAPLTLLLQ